MKNKDVREWATIIFWGAVMILGIIYGASDWFIEGGANIND